MTDTQSAAPETPAAMTDEQIAVIRTRTARHTFTTWNPHTEAAPSPDAIVRDVAYAADAREDLTWLLAEVERLTAEAEHWRRLAGERAEREARLVDVLERQAYFTTMKGLACRYCHAVDSGLFPRARDTYDVIHRDDCVLAARPTGMEDGDA